MVIHASGFLGFSTLASGWTWLGIAVYIFNFLCWLHVLRHLQLHLAFILMSSVHALVPLGSWFFLGESISLRRWLGIALVLAGIVLVAKPAMQAEEKL